MQANNFFFLFYRVLPPLLIDFSRFFSYPLNTGSCQSRVQKGELAMLKVLLFIFAVAYIGSIISKILKLSKITKCLKVLSSFLNSGNLDSYGRLTKSQNFDKCLEDLLLHYPSICKFSSFYDPTLSYGENPLKTYHSAIELYNNLRMRQNFLLDDLINVLNPINTIKQIATLPSSILKFFGYKPNVFASRLFNFLCWIFTYALGMYQDEIKAFIASLLKCR